MQPGRAGNLRSNVSLLVENGASRVLERYKLIASCWKGAEAQSHPLSPEIYDGGDTGGSLRRYRLPSVGSVVSL